MSSKSTDRTSKPCPCDSGRNYAGCCAPLHAGEPAPSAEALMRSRYSAYVMRLSDYLLDSWHPTTRPESMAFDRADTTRWLGLEVKGHAEIAADMASVEFVARWREGGHRAQRLHEISRFERVKGRWLYVNGEILSS
jgi:SEC-C motif domain protein